MERRRTLAIDFESESAVVIAQDTVLANVVADPLHTLGRLRAEVDKIAETEDFIGGHIVGNGQQSFVVAVDVRDEEDFHMSPSVGQGPQTCCDPARWTRARHAASFSSALGAGARGTARFMT